MPKFRVKVSERELRRLYEDYPERSKMFDAIVSAQGGYFNLCVDDEIATKLKASCDTDLYDRLFAKAHHVNSDKYYSYIIQLQEILKLPKSKVDRILEVGPGNGVLSSLVSLFDYHVDTLDVTEETGPTIVGSILDVPISDKSYDVVCAFEVLQHLPYRYFEQAISKMVACSKRYVLLSLPCPINHLYLRVRNKFIQRMLDKLSFDIELFGTLPFRAKDRDERVEEKRSDKHNPHFWEVNRRSHPKKSIKMTLASCGLKIQRDFHNPLFPYHWFIIGEVL